jgi:hypothetical protein
MRRIWQIACRPVPTLDSGGRLSFRSTLIGATIGIVLVPCLATTVVRIPIKTTGAGPLFQIHYGKKWGYMDRNGKTIIPPQFDDEGDFFNHRAKVRMDRKWGYIDEAGRMAVQPQFDNAGDFREELAPVQSGRRWGFIEPSGKFVVVPEFQAAGEFHDGLARFEVWDKIKCSMDYRKKEPELYSKDDAPLLAFRLHDKVAAAVGCFPENARFGYIDKGGKIAVAPRFVVGSDFSEGLAAVREDEGSESKYGYIDSTGKLVIRPQFDQAFSFSEGLAAVAIASDAHSGGNRTWSWGFINRGGTLQIRPSFRSAHSFSEGLADVSLRDGTWGYLDRNGKFTIRPRYSETNPFSEGLALVWPRNQENGYYIDKTGRKALNLGLWPQWSFSDGLTVAGKEGERKYVDRKGKIIAAYEVDPR